MFEPHQKLKQNTVTIAIPTYNEAASIEAIVTNFLHTTYPQLIEILVIDGGSSDGTQGIVAQLTQTDARIRLLHNPYKIQSAALNIAIAEAKGDIFLRADAHSDYAADYVERCVEALLETNALNVGGAQRFVAKTAFQAGVALATRSLLGSGGAKYRNPEYNGYADTVYLGCFWRAAFERLDRSQLRPTCYTDAEGKEQQVPSFFDLDQVANQDAELNLCLNELQPDAIYVSSRINVWYYPRRSWQRLCKQYFNYGRGRCRTVQHHTGAKQLRGQLPFLVLSLGLFTFLLDNLWLRRRLHTRKLFLAGLVLTFLEALRVTWNYRETFTSEIWRGEEEDIPSFFERWLFCGIALMSKPSVHFAGYAYQLYRIKVLRRDDF
jgi:glycosyltransferase involved in cell wall biosynthesis